MLQNLCHTQCCHPTLKAACEIRALISPACSMLQMQSYGASTGAACMGGMSKGPAYERQATTLSF